jgi:hypothetical protein
MKRGAVLASVLALGPLLAACGKTVPSEDPQHDAQTEAQREQDCADPQWKAANLGLWYNICVGDTDQASGN